MGFRNSEVLGRLIVTPGEVKKLESRPAEKKGRPLAPSFFRDKGTGSEKISGKAAGFGTSRAVGDHPKVALFDSEKEEDVCNNRIQSRGE